MQTTRPMGLTVRDIQHEERTTNIACGAQTRMSSSVTRRPARPFAIRAKDLHVASAFSASMCEALHVRQT